MSAVLNPHPAGKYRDEYHSPDGWKSARQPEPFRHQLERLFKLVLHGDKARATPFQDWVTKTVLPAICKDGAYVAAEEKLATGEMSEDELIHAAVQFYAISCGSMGQEPHDGVVAGEGCKGEI